MDNKESDYSRTKRFINKNYEFFQKFDITPDEIFKYHQENHSNIPLKDYLWALYNKFINDLKPVDNDYEDFCLKSSEIYWSMLLFRREVEFKEDYRLLKLARLKKLEGTKSNTGLKLEVQIVSHGDCNNCNPLNGKKFTINEILENPVLDNGKCESKPFCHAMYLTKPARDKDGNLLIEND